MNQPPDQNPSQWFSADPLEALVERFEQSWQERQPPSIEEYLEQAPPGASTALLGLLAPVDLERRLERGDDISTRTYLDRFPELVDVPSALVAMVGIEVRRGSTADPELLVEEYAQRFPELSDSLKKCLVAEPTDTVHHDSTGRPGAGTPGSTRPVPDERDRFERMRLHAEGGLGRVFLALDHQLGREVALKEMRPDRRGRSAETRFLLEAEITGGLVHPGIVPVHGLGRFDDGRPFYVMPFIRGESLQESAARLHAVADVHDRLAVRRLLTRFVAVCQAVEYAHRRGVIHRDLKPSNIMLGEFGETLVVDWGLARIVADADGELEAGSPGAIQPPTADWMDATVGVVGTPAYMSPEQARGDQDRVGIASDIYSLGATLFTLLTGKLPTPPPISGASDRHDAGPNVHPRVDGDGGNGAPSGLNADSLSGVPRPLRGIVRRAMDERPQDRYESAAALADDLERWLGDESVSAYTERPHERLWRWTRRHRSWTTTAAAALLLITVVSVVSAVVIRGQNREIRDLVRDEQLARARAEQEREQEEAITDLMFQTFRRADPWQDGRTLTVVASLERALEELDRNPTLSPESRCDLLLAIGTTLHSLGSYEESLVVLRRAYRLALRIYGPRDEHTLQVQQNLGVTLDYTGYDNESLEVLRENYRLARSVFGERHRETLRAGISLAAVNADNGHPRAAVEILEPILPAVTSEFGEDHLHTAVCKNNLAVALEMLGEHDRAVQMLEDLHRRRVTTSEDTESRYDLATINFAVSLRDFGEVGRALELLEEDLPTVQEKWGEDHPLVLTMRHIQADCYLMLQNVRRAQEIVDDVVARRTEVLGATHIDTLESLHQVARLHRLRGDYSEERDLLISILEILEDQLPAQHPRVVSVKHDLGIAYYLCDELIKSRDVLRECADVMQRRRPDHADTWITLTSLASVLLQLNELDEALPLMERNAIRLRTEVSESHPNTLAALDNLASVYRALRRYDEAVELMTEVLELKREHLGPRHRSTLIAVNNLALALKQAGRLEEAAPVYREAATLQEEEFGPEDQETLLTKKNLASCLNELELFPEAEECLAPTIPIRREHFPEYWMTYDAMVVLGVALRGQEKFEESEAVLLEGWEGLQEHGDQIPPIGRDSVRRYALDQLIRLYSDWGRGDEADRWKEVKAEAGLD